MEQTSPIRLPIAFSNPVLSGSAAQEPSQTAGSAVLSHMQASGPDQSQLFEPAYGSPETVPSAGSVIATASDGGAPASSTSVAVFFPAPARAPVRIPVVSQAPAAGNANAATIASLRRNGPPASQDAASSHLSMEVQTAEPAEALLSQAAPQPYPQLNPKSDPLAQPLQRGTIVSLPVAGAPIDPPAPAHATDPTPNQAPNQAPAREAHIESRGVSTPQPASAPTVSPSSPTVQERPLAAGIHNPGTAYAPAGLHAAHPIPAAALDATLSTPAPATFSQPAIRIANNPSPIQAASPPAAHDTFAALDAAASAPAAGWIHTGARHAEAGYLDPALGWVSVRAEASSGALHAVIVPGSSEAAQTLAGHLAGLNSYLAERHGPGSHASMAAPQAASGDAAFGQAGPGSGRDPSQQNAPQPGAADPVHDETASHPAVRATHNPALDPAVNADASTGFIRGGSHISVMA